MIKLDFSKYQLGVFDFINNDRGNACVEAVAGSGKSTTGLQAIERIPPVYQVQYSSFNKHIVKDLDERLKGLNLRNVKAKTYNSFGAGLMWKYMSIKPTLMEDKTEIMLKGLLNIHGNTEDANFFYKSKRIISRLVSLCKNLALMKTVDVNIQFESIIERYDFEVPKFTRFLEIFLDTYEKCITNTQIIDWDDQKFLPIKLNFCIPQVDILIVDEYQDTSPIESILMMKTCERGRKIVFGDRFQSIYSFKGTTPNAMQKYIEENQAKVLPLSICYRCPKAAIRAAQKIVPQIEWAPWAIEGCEEYIKKAEYHKRVGENDMVLARVTEDLVKSCLKMISEDKAAYIEGKEYGVNLCYLVDKVANDDYMRTEVFSDLLNVYYQEQMSQYKALNREGLALQLESRYDSLRAIMLSRDTDTVGNIKKKIDTIFTTNGSGVRHMTIHKSKGLEGKKDGDVYVLRPDRIPHPRAKKDWMQEEEQRLKYVAITRTKRGLYWVEKEKDEK